MNNIYNDSDDWNDGQIHGWNGGDCPVHPETVVEYWLRRDKGYECQVVDLRWKHINADTDIIAFRVVKEYVEPKVIWVVEEDDHIDWIADNETEARRYAGNYPESRRVKKYVEAIADAKDNTCL